MKTMVKEYWISRAVLCVFAMVAVYIIFINEDSSWWIVRVLLVGVVFALSFLSEIISRQLIKLGDSKDKTSWKLFCYLLLPIAIIGTLLAVLWLVDFIESEISLNANITYDSMGDAMSYAFAYLFVMVAAFIGIILPYLQTLIVLPLRKIMNRQ